MTTFAVFQSCGEVPVPFFNRFPILNGNSQAIDRARIDSRRRHQRRVMARELALNGVGVVIVDSHDVACGATSASSRLIHGGLRYLEYREFDLVRESLDDRTRLFASRAIRPSVAAFYSAR